MTSSTSAKPPRKRATQREMTLQQARIFEKFAAGVTIEEIALKERLTVRCVRERLSAVFARRQDQSPQDFAQLQIRRLSEALLVSWAAMGGGNLDAVDRVVRITREMDRYQGFSIRRLTPPCDFATEEPRALAAPSRDAPLQSAPLPNPNRDETAHQEEAALNG